MDALVLPPPMQLLIYLLYGAVFGYIGEVLAGKPLPLHFVGSILVAALGAWLAVDLLKLHLGSEIVYQQVPLLSAGLGALVTTLLWTLLWRGRGKRRYRLSDAIISLLLVHLWELARPLAFALGSPRIAETSIRHSRHRPALPFSEKGN